MLNEKWHDPWLDDPFDPTQQPNPLPAGNTGWKRVCVACGAWLDMDFIRRDGCEKCNPQQTQKRFESDDKMAYKISETVAENMKYLMKLYNITTYRLWCYLNENKPKGRTSAISVNMIERFWTPGAYVPDNLRFQIRNAIRFYSGDTELTWSWIESSERKDCENGEA